MQRTLSLSSLLSATCMAASLVTTAQTSTNHDVDFTIDEAAMVRIVDAGGGPTTNLNFHVQAPSLAGQAFPAIPSQNLYLQYTSVKGASPDNVRQVDVEVVGGSMPSGIQMTITPSLSGTGTLGNATPVSFSGSTVSGTLITDIQSAYTGDGAGDGALLNYSLNYATQNLDAATSGVITLRYTISNN
ncbi:MAG: hypothetical protein RL168_407 [Bacteroidota bacterium]|jgi:hypothetical protein